MRRGIEVERGKGGREGGEEEDREGRRERGGKKRVLFRREVSGLGVGSREGRRKVGGEGGMSGAIKCVSMCVL